MLRRLTIPYLEEAREIGGQSVWVTSEQKWGIVVSLSPLDSEARSLLPLFERLGEYFRQLPTGIKLQFISRTRAHWEPEEKGHSRILEVNQLGSLNTSLYLSIEFSHLLMSLKNSIQKLKSVCRGEMDFSVHEFQVKALLSQVDLGALEAIGLKPIPTPLEEVKDLWPWEDLEIADFAPNIELGPSIVTGLRLWKPGIYPISTQTLSSIRAHFSDEVDFVVSLQKIHEAKSRIQLNRKKKQSQSGTSLVDAIQSQDTEQQLSEAVLEGAVQYAVEWSVLLQRSSEERLRQDALILKRELKKMGEMDQETWGAAETYAASFPGGGSVQTFLEKDYHIPYYLPWISAGACQKDAPQRVAPHALCIGRRDGSLDYLDFWQKENLNYSAIVGGASGSGKSVLLQKLLSSFHHNPQMRITNVDAGGSSLETCRKQGAQIHELNLGSPSGIVPFEWIQTVNDLEFLDKTLVTFLSTLILEEKEDSLPKTLTAMLENEASKYVRSQKLGHFNGMPVHPEGRDLSMDGFLRQLPADFPRRVLLQRWGTGGKFSTILKRDPHHNVDLFSNRHHCYNFKSIAQAADKDFAQAAGALVLAQANLESWKANQTPGSRYVQVYDETKFLFRRCIDQFLLLVTNVRKLGQSLVLVSQDTSDFLIPPGISESRLSVFNNCQTHILFYNEAKVESREEGMQKGEESFPGRHGLGEREYQLVRSLQGNPPHYSEFYIQDGKGSRVGRLSLTPEEYFRTTSHPTDLDRKRKLKQAVPELSEEEIVQWMVRIDLKEKEKFSTASSFV